MICQSFQLFGSKVTHIFSPDETGEVKDLLVPKVDLEAWAIRIS